MFEVVELIGLLDGLKVCKWVRFFKVFEVFSLKLFMKRGVKL